MDIGIIVALPLYKTEFYLFFYKLARHPTIIAMFTHRVANAKWKSFANSKPLNALPGGETVSKVATDFTSECQQPRLCGEKC